MDDKLNAAVAAFLAAVDFSKISQDDAAILADLLGGALDDLNGPYIFIVDLYRKLKEVSHA